MSFLASLQGGVSLNSVEPVITRLDGTKFVEKNDGTHAELASEMQDEDGNWAIMDENAATGVDGSAPEAVDDDGVVEASAEPHQPDREGLEKLLADDPTLQAYIDMLEGDGLPLPVVKSRLTGTHGIAFANHFIDAVNASGEGPAGGAAVDSAVLRGEFAELHGRMGDRDWASPRLATRCGELARPGYNSGRAHEYLDEPEVLRAKVKLLAELFRASKRPVIYAGAGLSTSAGVSDYATRAGSESVLCRAKNVTHATHTSATSASDTTNAISGGGGGLCGAGKVLSPFAAKPSLGHHVIAALAHQGHVWRFIQQNHDGLPQKAGMPQHLMNEIHGGWFDPSNPVVKMSGALRGDLFADLLTCEQEADLVLAVGTSLSGMNADRVVSTCASKARKPAKKAAFTKSLLGGSSSKDRALGSVIVSLQRTPHDANSSLRIYALIDDVMALLAEELALDVHDNASNKAAGMAASVPATYQPDPLIQKMIGGKKAVDVNVFSVPYGPDGLRTTGAKHTLDLREGAKVMLTEGPQKGELATVTGRNADGHWRLRITHRQVSNSGSIKEFGEVRLLGAWWASCATEGTVASIPVVTPVGAAAAAAAAADAA